MWFVYGNYSADEAIEIVGNAQEKFNMKPVPKDKLRAVRTVNLPAGRMVRLDQEVIDPANDNSCTMTYYQG